MGSHDTRDLGEILAKSRFKVAIRAADNVVMVCDVCVSVAVRIKVNGMVAIRASVKMGRTA